MPSEYRDPRVDPRAGDVLLIALRATQVREVDGDAVGVSCVTGDEWELSIAGWHDRAQHAVVLWQDDAPPPADVALLAAANRALAERVERAERERDALLAEKGAWINLGTSADLRADRMLAALARIGVVVHTRATAPSLDLAERQLRSDVAAARELADAVIAEIAQLRTARVDLAAERDEARRVLIAIAEDVYAHPYRYTLAMLRRVLGIPPDGVESAAPDVRSALRRLCGVSDG